MGFIFFFLLQKLNLLTDPAENVNIGKNKILNCVSGYFAQTYPNIAIIAPDFEKKNKAMH